MANQWFQFKSFLIKQSESAMKVGTDGVLLGAWANIPSKGVRVLDVGAGTGLISIMLAQRFPEVRITGIEIDELSFNEAIENVGSSDWSERIKIKNISLQKFRKLEKEKFDLMVSNPPFFINSMKPSNTGRSTARHQDSLRPEDLFETAETLLSPKKGLLSLIFPYDQKIQIQKTAEYYSLNPVRIMNIRPKPGVGYKRCLMEFSFVKQKAEEHEIIIELERHHYSKEYMELTKDFYLAF